MKTILLLCYLLSLALGLGLRALNLRHLRRHGGEVPPPLAGLIAPEKLAESSAYTLAQSRFGLIETLFSSLLVLAFFFGGLLPVYDGLFAGAGSFVLRGVGFFLGLMLILELLDLPFSLYRTFSLEARFGFNTSGFGLWLADQTKGLALGAVLGGLLISGALALIRWSPERWWLWVWGFFAVVSIFLMYLSPYIIEPLFHKFTPVTEEGLEEKIRALLARAGLKVSRVQQVDASRRSRHSNAYFTGIGRVKRIVLYDTLIEQLEEEELLAVLAHEVGHWKKGHILKRLLMTEGLSFVLCYLAFALLRWGGLPALLGLPAVSFYAQAMILGFLLSLGGFFLTPLGSALSRRHEWQADAFATDLTETPQALAAALAKLSRDNLA
ncbi:MAG TPA: M48 family metallopeptidase, partial [Desulfuromonadales bacterium]|nr:M48 family metallopeptidase [Desulfuromonadales bacterium]